MKTLSILGMLVMFGLGTAMILTGCSKNENVLPMGKIIGETSSENKAAEDLSKSDIVGESIPKDDDFPQISDDVPSSTEDIVPVMDILTCIQLEAGAQELSPSNLFEEYTDQQVVFQTNLTEEQLAVADSTYEIEVIYMDSPIVIKVEIIDTTPPSIEGVCPLFMDAGGTVSYKKGITLSDNASGDVTLEIDNSFVDSNVPGIYPVYYTATDTSGNQSTAETTITVNEVISSREEEVNALADTLIAQLITPEMNAFDTAFALWSWCRYNIRYVATPVDYEFIWEAAYQGLDGKSGDCYIYYATYTLLLNRCGIENLCITRSGGATEHWWNLVNTGNGWYHCDSSPLRKGDPYICFMQTDAQLQAYVEAHPERPDYYSFDGSLYPDRETTVIYGEDPAASADPEH